MAKPDQRAVNERTGCVAFPVVQEGDGAWDSFRGLMLRSALPNGHSLLLRPTRGIHTHFMRFPIDLVFLDAGNRVTKIREAMRPWRFDFTVAAGVIEAQAGAARAADMRVGDVLRFDRAE